MGILDRLFGKRGADGGGKSATPREHQNDDLREPAIWLRRVEGPKTQSRLGGLPSLPAGIDWPRQTASGTPLHFLAQIDLSEMPPTPLDAAIDDARLPSRGMLYFFADIEEEMLWGWGDERGDDYAASRVIFAEMPGPDRAPPADIPEIGHAFGEMSGGYARGLTIYPARSVQPHVIETFAGAERYFQGGDSVLADELTVASIERATGRPLPVLATSAPRDETNKHPAYWLEYHYTNGQPPRREVRIARHQMLGAAINVQNTADAARQAGHVLLLQIDSDYGVDDSFVFCDMGMAQFWIKPEDLAAGRFERAWGTTEGG